MFGRQVGKIANINHPVLHLQMFPLSGCGTFEAFCALVVEAGKERTSINSLAPLPLDKKIPRRSQCHLSVIVPERKLVPFAVTIKSIKYISAAHFGMGSLNFVPREFCVCRQNRARFHQNATNCDWPKRYQADARSGLCFCWLCRIVTSKWECCLQTQG